MKKMTNVYLPALFIGLIFGACAGEEEQTPISSQNAALVQKAATDAVTGLQGQLTAEILAMIGGAPGELLMGELSSFTVDTVMPSEWGGNIAVKGIGSATAISANFDLDLSFEQYKDQVGVVLNGVLEMKTQIKSFDPLDLSITLKGVFDLVDELSAELEDLELDLDINVSDIETYVCGLIESVDVSDVLCGGSGGGNTGNVPDGVVTCQQEDSNACASTYNACVAQCDPINGYEACVNQCSVDFCACLELAGCQDATQNCDLDAGGQLPPGEELPEDGEIPEDICTQEAVNECSSTYNSCVNDCDPINEYQQCAAECTDDFCSCMADADCEDPSGQCSAQ